MAANEGNNTVTPPRDNLLEYSLSKGLTLLSHFSFSENDFHLDFFENLLVISSCVFVYELSGCRFEPHCCPLNFRYGACFEQGVLEIEANYRVWIHSETLTWHDNNIWLISNFSLLFSFKLLISALNNFFCLQVYGSQLLDPLVIKLYPFLSMP